MSEFAPELLHIKCSPREERSRSLCVARQFMDRYREARPDAKVEELDLWNADLPRFDGDMLAAKYAVLAKEPHTPSQAEAWREIERWWRLFDRAKAVLFSIPMWNRSVPYVLKQFIDIVTQPGLAFSFTPGVGYRGLAREKQIVVIYASASDYSPGALLEDADFQRPYFEHWLGFIGLDDIVRVTVAPTMGAPREVDAAMRNAVTRAEELARAMGEQEHARLVS